MADYSSLKVADLKAELKKRGIPQTGLRLKQHFIDKLVEEDAKGQTGDAAPEAEAAEPEAAESETKKPEAPPEPTDAAPQAQEPPTEEPQSEEPKQPEAPVTEETEPSQAIPTPDTTHEETKKPSPPAPEQATDNGEPAGFENPMPAAPTEPSVEVAKEPAETDSVEQASGIADQIDRADFAISSEKARLSASLISEANTGLSTPLPIEEALEDKRKRKRRSQSPVPTPQAIANKKARAKDESSRSASLDDARSVPGEESTSAQESPEVQKKEAPVPAKDARFRGLFAPTEPDHSPAKDVIMEEADVEPARHPATASLYIDGLMRPLQPPALRNHLISIASPSGASPNPDVVQQFFLDSIKTHCFVQFSDIAAAARVRLALHGRKWPDERNRKNLWVDFIPDQKVQEWIRTEEASRDRAGPPVRWEVAYETTDDATTATLTEAGANRSAPSRPREPGFNRTPPLGPRGSHGQVERASNAPPPARPGQGFKPLDELFKSTTAKPKLYYLPVPRPIADKRLDQFDELLRKGEFPRRGGDETRRITFEDDDYFVDVGPEYGAAAMQRRQDRGGRGRGRRP
ncbi:Arf GTPase activating protein [Penicillium atrosanguineum]|uniref:Arf GTPase activating protein n=1 Tax=Penicillium atrosanguineum TaxID=1132637 RepID=UPI00238D4F98|nr:Arf GTPase activating protein [Penicillium atrosanguineum]KAJ5304054.1 Arf GTPase activating protein [Penicillium atrosanguineum]